MNNLKIKIKSLGHFLDYIVKNLVTKSFYFILDIFHMKIYGQMKLLFDAYNPVTRILLWAFSQSHNQFLRIEYFQHKPYIKKA